MKAVAYIILFFIASTNAVRNIPCEFSISPSRGYECRLPEEDLSLFDDFTILGGTHLPGFNDNLVVSFVSVHNNFREFPTVHLARFPSLQSIDISGSLITELRAYAVANRTQLQVLRLANNEITRIDTNAFQGTTGINELNLMFNYLRTIDNAVFAQFPNLTTLDLSFNLIERIVPNSLSNNNLVTTLTLNSNRISFINQSFFDNVPALSNFMFSANLCYDGIFFNVHLTANRIDMFTRLSTCFNDPGVNWRCQFGRQFSGIDFDNQYMCLLRGIEAYDYGKTINLGGVHEPGLTNVNVTYAWVDTSNVRFIIRQFFVNFVNLAGMHITSSNLQVIQANAFQGATNLRYLTIMINNVNALYANSFVGAQNLQQLKIIHSNLEYIHENAFAGLVNLRELQLTGGRLTTNNISPFVFAPLINLNTIEANDNLINVVDSRWFENNTNIVRISFDRNYINAIHPSLIDKPTLNILRLLENDCIDAVFNITAANREQVRTELSPCMISYPLQRRVFTMELIGDMEILDSEGNVIGTL